MSVNLCNWNQPENTAWSFRNTDQIFNPQPITRGEKSSLFHERLLRFDEFKVKNSDDQSVGLSSFLKGTETDGLIVLHHGKIACEYYDRSNTEKSTHIVMSMTKSVIGLITGILVQRGKLEVSKPVSFYVPEIIGTSFEKVTVRDCLDMRAGLKFDNANLEYRKASGLIPQSCDEEPMNLHTFFEAFEAPQAPEVEGVGGATFDYLSINADLMGWVIERASGTEFGELVSELLWQPMGAESDAYITVDSGGNARTCGGLCATLRDLARLGQLLVDDSNGVLPAEWISDMVHNGSKEAFEAGSWQKGLKKDFKTIAYRSFWLADSEKETLIGLGIHGQLMFVDRLNEIVMVQLCSQPARLDAQKKDLAIAAFKEFQRILVGSQSGTTTSSRTKARMCGCTLQ